LEAVLKELKRLRELAGWTQIHLAKKSGMDRTRLSMAECGHVVLTAQERENIRRVLLREIEHRDMKLRAVLDKPDPVTAEA
jgi:transcriptional regulator with XRE-family HTH domain